MPTLPVRKPDQKQKVLVYLFGSLGDSIVAIPALRAVRRHFPNAEIVILHDFASTKLVAASEVIPSQLFDRHMSYGSTAQGARRVLDFYELLRRVRAEKFDAAVYAVMSERPPRSVIRDKYFFRACGIKALYGFHAIPPEKLWPVDADGHPGVSDHEAEFRLARLSIDGIKTEPQSDLQTPLFEFSREALALVDSWLRERRKKPGVPLYSIAPGCKTEANLWPLENFVDIGKRILAKYDCEIMITGGPAEFETAERLALALGTELNAAGVFAVHTSSALMSRSHLHIGLDTGTTHLAAAAGTSCFAIFGERNNPGAWYPLGQGHTIVYHRVPCAKCKTQICPIRDHPCMLGISADAVWTHLDRALSSPSKNGIEVVAV